MLMYLSKIREDFIIPRSLCQLSEYFGVDEKFFLDISEDDKEFIVSKALYRRQDNEKEVYCFVKQGEMADDFKYRPFSHALTCCRLTSRMSANSFKDILHLVLINFNPFMKTTSFLITNSLISALNTMNCSFG